MEGCSSDGRETTASAAKTQTSLQLYSDVSLTGPFRPFLVIEKVLENLKLLNYESGFCRPLHYKPLSRNFFALATNPGEQFNYFVTLTTWLLKQHGCNADWPHETDDPNAVIATILDSMRKMGFKPDFAPSKLKSGFGEHCIDVLDYLTTQVLVSKKFAWKRPVYQKEEADVADHVDENELKLTIEIDCPSLLSVSDEFYDDDGLGVDELETRGDESTKLRWTTHSLGLQSSCNPKLGAVLESSVDAVEWKLEIERALPHLTSAEVQHDCKDWRDRLQTFHRYANTIEPLVAESGTQLRKLYDGIEQTLNKIASREKYISQQLQVPLADFSAAQNACAEYRNAFRRCTTRLEVKSAMLAEITEDVERVKQEMESRGTAMTDGTPLVKVKQAIAQTRAEIAQMDVRIALLQHLLLHQSIKAKFQLQETVSESYGASC